MIEQRTIVVHTFTAVCDRCGEHVETVVGDRSQASRALRRHKYPKPQNCEACGKTFRACTKMLIEKKHGCCEACFTYDTHSVSLEDSVAFRRALEEELREKKEKIK